jgi:drug/metabolite transporter (DMT)-like permease
MAITNVTRQRLLFDYLCFVWGTTWLAMKEGVSAVPPAFFSGLRWTVAGLALLVILRARGERVRVNPENLGRLLLVSILLITFNATLSLYSLRYVTSGLAAVISAALTPISLTGFAVAVGQERFSRRQAVSMAIGTLGIVLLFGPSAMEGQLNLAEALGALGLAISCLSYSAGSVLSRPLMRGVPAVHMAALTNLIGGAIQLVLALLFEPGALHALSLNWGFYPWLAWWYLLLPASLGATTIYFLLVRDWGVSGAGMYAFISPVIAVFAGMAMFGETVTPAGAAGMALMLLAAGVLLRRKS